MDIGLVSVFLHGKCRTDATRLRLTSALSNLADMGKAKHSSRQSGCGIAYGLDAFGDKWTLVIVRDMILSGKRRYGELLACPEKIASNILADRLKSLEAEGVIAKKKDIENVSKSVYELTSKGKELVPLLLEIMIWGSKYAPHPSAPARLLRWAKSDGVGLEKTILACLQKKRPFIHVLC